MGSSFQRRRLRITFKLASGAFDKEGEPDTVVVEDFRVRARINAPGGFSLSQCQASIYGLSKETMDRLTFINYQNLDFMRNTMMVEATDDQGEYTIVFFGEIFQAVPDYNSMPDVPLHVEAMSGMIGKLAAATAGTFPGTRKVSEIMQTLADGLGMNFENNGVDTSITDMVLTGSNLEKAQTLAEAADIQMWFLPQEQILSIAPKGKPRESTEYTYNIDTGLVGFPVKLHVGIQFQSLYTREVRHGTKIKMESSVPICNGDWYIIGLNFDLSSMEPGGPWFVSTIATPYQTFIALR